MYSATGKTHLMKLSFQELRVWLLMLPIPFMWLGAQITGGLSTLENLAMDLRFNFRGELESPSVNLQYVNLDADAIRYYLGERPWPKEKFGVISKILIELGGAKAVGFDLVLSDAAASDLVPEENLNVDKLKFALDTRKHGNIILATAYTQGLTLPYIEPFGDIPVVPKDEVEHPERPSTLYYLYHGISQLGLINFDFERSNDTAPRWLPMYFRVETEFKDYQEDITKASNFIGGYLKRMPGQGREVTEEGLVDYFDNGELMFKYPFEDPTVPSDYFHISLQLLRVANGLPPESIQYTPEAITLKGNDGELIANVPLKAQQMLEINYFSKWDSPRNRMESIAELLVNYQRAVSNNPIDQSIGMAFFNKYKDAIVLIGPTDPLLQDIAPTPFDRKPVAKVSVHGNVLKQVAEGIYINRLPDWVNWFCLIMLTLLISGMAIQSGSRSSFFKVLSMLLVAFYILGTLYIFSRYHLIVPLVAPAGSALSTAFVGIMVRLLSEEQQKSRIKGMFGTYVEPELVNQMIESGQEPELGGEEKEITAFFSDVQSFSAFSEILTPHQLVELMNEYLTGMAGILKKQGGGAVDKYIGDAIVGIFNAPVNLENHAYRACIATQHMHKEQIRLREKWKSEGDKWPERVWNMQTRIGLNTGMAVVGNMGSEDRFNYTMMGDTVNLAARMESGSKAYGAYTMVTGETYRAAIEVGDAVVFRYLDKIVVKGRSQPAEVYEIVCLREDLNDETAECLNIYDQATERYLAADFQGALELYEKSLLLEPNRPEKNPHAPPPPSAVLIERCKDLLKDPPTAEKWDGVYVMTTK